MTEHNAGRATTGIDGRLALTTPDKAELADRLQQSSEHCCVDGERVRLVGVVPRSDCEGEFGEGRRKPMLWVEFHAEFVVAAAGSRQEIWPHRSSGGFQ